MPATTVIPAKAEIHKYLSLLDPGTCALWVFAGVTSGGGRMVMADGNCYPKITEKFLTKKNPASL